MMNPTKLSLLAYTMLVYMMLAASILSQEVSDRVGAMDRPARATVVDREIILWMLGEYEKEIEIARIGKQNAASELVRQFAGQLVKDHELAIVKFSRWINDVNPSDSHVVITDDSRALANHLWLSIHRDIQERTLNSTKTALASRAGSDFDKEFLKEQVRFHREKKDIDRIVAQFASPACRTKLEECFEVDATHLKQANRILKTLQDDATFQTVKR
jgi:predicted outer membrane protein